jgi:polar amino acid transport system ATP-binding protein/sulfate transport system ATP-binding protein
MNSTPYQLAETLLKVDGVNLNLGGKQILRDLHLEVRDIKRPGMAYGQVVGLLGPSGMGKTRLFRILAGLDKPDSGTVLIGEEQEPVKRGWMGVVAQNYPLFQHRNVMGNLLLAGKLSGLNATQAEEKAKAILEQFELSDHHDKYPSQLSGGQRQRVSIAQQFMYEEEFLLMDEPFSGLDFNAITRVSNFIGNMVRGNDQRTVIIVTHDISAAMCVCDTLWLLGRDSDGQGGHIPGARIQKVYNLIDYDLAWHENVSSQPEFFHLLSEVRQEFSRL